MSKLYEITNELSGLLDPVDGELTDEAIAQIDALGMDLDAKINGVCGLIAQWKSEVAARQAEIDRLRAGIESRENRGKRIKQYLQDCLAMLGERKHATAIWTCWVQKNPPSAKLDESLTPQMLDAQFQRVKYEPDNRAAIEYWKENGIAPTGFIVEQSESLRVK